ncbi:Vgb family protein [Algoriphagus formosus]|uniref:Vgb family protein n=1 Tax=Algoriphagus formosus TaxID=2007308 RepID=UPI003F7212BF
MMNNRRRAAFFRRNQEEPVIPIITAIPKGPIGNESFIGAVLSETGNIYMVPFSSASILKLDPSTDNVTLIPYVGGRNKHFGGFRAPNGNIYFSPLSRNSYTRLDPVTDTYTDIPLGFGVSNAFGMPVLAQNGIAYSPPFNTSNILRFDPSTETASLIPAPGFGGVAFESGCLAPNGFIYFIPRRAESIIKFDPITETYITIPISTPGDAYIGATLVGTDIYAMGWIDRILKFDTLTDTFTETIFAQDPVYGLTQAANGKLYGSPWSGNFFTEWDPVTNTGINYPTGFGSSQGGIIMSQSGDLYTTPYGSNNILKISNVGTANPNQYTIPDPISGILGSSYNEFQNRF